MTDLERRLREGTGADDASIARVLGVAALDEQGFARALTERIGAEAQTARQQTARQARPRIGEGDTQGADPASALEAGAARREQHDFLHRLEPISRDGERGIDRIEDTATLLAVLRGGSLRQRRAATVRLGELGDGRTRELRAQIDEALATVRDDDLALEIGRARARLGIADSSDLETDDALAQRVLAELQVAIPRYYEGEIEGDPLLQLDAEARALVGSRLRSASPLVIAHLATLLEGGGDEGEAQRASWLGAVRSVGDPRLVPTLGALLDAPERGLVLEAARALGRTDTASARVLLAGAFRRSSTPADRALLGGMLGLQGVDHVEGDSVLAELRDTMRAEDPRARLAAAEAIGPLATSEDFEPLASLLGSGSLALDRAVVRSLGRLGDARGVRLLRAQREGDRGAALSVEVAEALRAIRAQMELRGERDVPEGLLAPEIPRAASPWWARAIAHLHLAMAAVLARLGLHARALKRLERATRRARELASPWVAKGRLFEARGASAESLVVFRRAIEIDRAFVERTPSAVRAVARAFLRRAEASAREGRVDVAAGLLEEVHALDLRRVPVPLRQALRREREKLAREEST